jgi:hypothetical protein
MGETFNLLTDREAAQIRDMFDEWFKKIRVEYAELLIDCGKEVSGNRWYVRLRGQTREAITVWFYLNQRSLFVETQFMPAPEVNVEQCLSYLMIKNNSLNQLHFSIGFENAIYLVGSTPASTLSVDVLDELLGTAYVYTEEYFAVAMSIGYQGKYRYSYKR